jgi:hypothetical protein
MKANRQRTDDHDHNLEHESIDLKQAFWFDLLSAWIFYAVAKSIAP